MDADAADCGEPVGHRDAPVPAARLAGVLPLSRAGLPTVAPQGAEPPATDRMSTTDKRTLGELYTMTWGRAA